MAPVIRELASHPDQIISCVCVTAQHRQMLDQVLSLFNIAPDYDLNVMQENQSLAQITSKILCSLEPVLLEEKPDWVLVQGDTTTVMASALVAHYHKLPVGHVEAGLRTHNKLHPFPEEVNRRITAVVADLHFAPTQAAKQNLIREGIDEKCIHVTGNTVMDALLHIAKQPFESRGTLTGVPWEKKIILVTAHRRENHGKPIINICNALLEIVASYSDVHILYPVHPNPSIYEPVYRLLSGNPKISLLQPMDYLNFVHILQRSYIVLTDSGGLQEEAPSLGKPVLVLRDATERPEAVEAGMAKLVGTETKNVVFHLRRLLEDVSSYEIMAHSFNPYGDGTASKRIVSLLY